MTTRLAALAALLLAAPAPLLAQQRSTLERDVRYLASDALGGRLTGSAGADSAAAYLARRFRRVGLRPTEVGYEVPFTVNPDAPAVRGTPVAGARAVNVVGVLPGRDPALRAEAVVVGAHYDHLGPGPFGALDPDATGQPHNGADDNASGTASLLRIAEVLRRKRPRRTVVFVAFSGEEFGLLGSAHYVRAPLWPMDRTIAMVNLDMVGRLRADRLLAFGAETAAEFKPILDSVNAASPRYRFDLKAQGDGFGPSDHASFYAARKPVLHMFTDLHEDYHRATDDADRIDYAGLERVATFTADVVHAIADRPAGLTVVDLPPPAPRVASASGRPGGGSSLGTIPDMAAGGPGVTLSGVRTGGPADLAGLQQGDVILALGGLEVADLQGLTDALQALSAGDVVDVVVRRGGRTLTLKATLGAPRGR